MCDGQPNIDEDIIKNTVTITTLNNEYENFDIDSNDFFLLILEYLEKFKNSEIPMTKKYIEVSFMNISQKICHYFVNECVNFNEVERVKTIDMYDKYIKWYSKKKFDVKFSKVDLFAELRKYKVTYKKTARIDGKMTSAFFGMTLK